MRKIFSLFAALTLSVGLWAQGSVITYTATEKLEEQFLNLGAVDTHDFNDGVGSVTFCSTITSIGENAFNTCSALQSITLPASILTIEGHAFSECIALHSITLSATLTTIGEYAFFYCTALQSITLPATLMTIGESAFEGCEALQSVTCKAIVPPTCGDDAFDNTSIPLYVPAGTKALYQNADQWKDFGNIVEPAPAPEVGEQFNDATSGLFFEVTAVGDNNTVKVLPGVYEKSSYIIPASVTFKEVAFAVTEIDESAFTGCDALNSITIPASVITIGEYAFQYRGNLASVTFAEGSQLATIGYEAFYGCEALTSITLPASVTTIGEEAFSNCIELTSITIPASVTTIGKSAFEYCDALASVTFAEGSQLQTIGAWAFHRCEVLPNITIPASVTEIGEKTFLECTALTDIYVEAANTHYISEDGVLFDYAKDKLIQYPIGNTRTTYTIPTTVTTIELFSFYFATLTSVNIPASVTTIGECAFGECEALTSINIPASVTEIGELAFAFCLNLATITFAEGSQLTTVGYGAFSGCEVISSLDIPASVTNIGEMAFGYNPNLYDVTVHWTDAGNLPEMGEWVFAGIAGPDDDTYLPTFATLHVPAGTKNMYKAAEQWQDFGIIEELAPAVEVYTRDVTEGNWGTICLPWESVALEGGDFYDVLGTKHAEYGVALIELGESDQLTAGKPYVFKATSSQIKVTYDPATGVDNPVAGNHIIGSFAGCTVPNGMYIIYNNLLYITNGSATIGTNRAYFDVDNMGTYNPLTAPARVVFMGGHQTPTGIALPSKGKVGKGSTKLLREGQLIIIRDGKEYNAQGQMLQ